MTSPSRPVFVGPVAKLKVAQAAAAYEAVRPGLADALLDEFEQIRRDIETFPKRWQPIEPGFHCARFHSFPLEVIYEVAADAVYILTLFPDRGDPAVRALWLSRRSQQ